MKKLDLGRLGGPGLSDERHLLADRKEMLNNPNAPLNVLVGDETARENVSRLAESMGYTIEVDKTEGGFSLGLNPADSPVAESDASAVSGPTVAFLTSDAMGRGDDELGRLLMKNYLFTLTEMQNVPDKMLLVNAAVKLACDGSDALEALEKIACMGTDIAACGLCLEFFELKEKLQVGRTTNMLEVAESLQTAGRVIRI